LDEGCDHPSLALVAPTFRLLLSFGGLPIDARVMAFTGFGTSRDVNEDVRAVEGRLVPQILRLTIRMLEH
jgi:hypothetical protein